MNWADELIVEYKGGRAGLKNMKENLSDFPQDQQKKTQINSMIDSMNYSIDWMETGQQSDSYRGVSTRGIYQFEDMDIIPDITEQLRGGAGRTVYESGAETIASETVPERQCYVMYEEEGLSMAEISAKLGICKATVQVYIKRVREKVVMIAS